MTSAYPATTIWLASVAIAALTSVGVLGPEIGVELLASDGVVMWSLIRGRHRG